MQLRQTIGCSKKSHEKHGWWVCVSLPKHWVCFSKPNSWYWGLFTNILEPTRSPSNASETESTGGKDSATREAATVSSRKTLESLTLDSGWVFFPKPPGSLYDMCLVNRNHLVTSQLLRTKVQMWKQPSCLAGTHDLVLVFLGDAKFSWFDISSPSVFNITDAQWKQAK